MIRLLFVPLARVKESELIDIYLSFFYQSDSSKSGPSFVYHPSVVVFFSYSHMVSLLQKRMPYPDTPPSSPNCRRYLALFHPSHKIKAGEPVAHEQLSRPCLVGYKFRAPSASCDCGCAKSSITQTANKNRLEQQIDIETEGSLQGMTVSKNLRYDSALAGGRIGIHARCATRGASDTFQLRERPLTGIGKIPIAPGSL